MDRKMCELKDRVLEFLQTQKGTAEEHMIEDEIGKTHTLNVRKAIKQLAEQEKVTVTEGLPGVRVVTITDSGRDTLKDWSFLEQYEAWVKLRVLKS